MIGTAKVWLPLTCLAALTISGCSSFYHTTEDGRKVRRWSDEWWAIHSAGPVGTRQVEKHGKLWPPYQRPVGKELPMAHRFHAAHYWPWPYNCQDREYVQTITQMQADNGWMAQTTLYDYHFDPETNLLNHAGRLHLRWILESAPPQYRQAWVQGGDNQVISAQRMNSVREEAIAMVGEEHLLPITMRLTSPLGRPALEVDTIRRAELQSMPDPRITYTALPTGTGDSGP